MQKERKEKDPTQNFFVLIMDKTFGTYTNYVERLFIRAFNADISANLLFKSIK